MSLLLKKAKHEACFSKFMNEWGIIWYSDGNEATNFILVKIFSDKLSIKDTIKNLCWFLRNKHGYCSSSLKLLKGGAKLYICNKLRCA